MKTVKELYDSTIKFKSWRHSYPDITVNLKSITPNTRARLLTFGFVADSQTNKKKYNVWVQFYNVEFSDHPLSSTSVKIIDKETKEPLYFERISLTDKRKQNYVRVRCACSDFRFRFAWEDLENECLYGGRPKSYQRKPGSNRPPVNPEHYPGFCKHIWECLKTIQHYFAR